MQQMPHKTSTESRKRKRGLLSTFLRKTYGVARANATRRKEAFRQWRLNNKEHDAARKRA